MDEQTVDTIVNWWVHFTDLTYIKQDTGNRQIDKIITLDRLTSDMLTEQERDLFKSALKVILNRQTKSFTLSVDYNPEELLSEALLLCGEVGKKIEILLPIKTVLNYYWETKDVVVKLGYSGAWVKLNK